MVKSLNCSKMKVIDRYNHGKMLFLTTPISQCDKFYTIGHFTVVYSVTWPMNGSEAAGDLVWIQTSLFLSCKSCCCDVNWPAFV